MAHSRCTSGLAIWSPSASSWARFSGVTMAAFLSAVSTVGCVSSPEVNLLSSAYGIEGSAVEGTEDSELHRHVLCVHTSIPFYHIRMTTAVLIRRVHCQVYSLVEGSQRRKKVQCTLKLICTEHWLTSVNGSQYASCTRPSPCLWVCHGLLQLLVLSSSLSFLHLKLVPVHRRNRRGEEYTIMLLIDNPRL